MLHRLTVIMHVEDQRCVAVNTTRLVFKCVTRMIWEIQCCVTGTISCIRFACYNGGSCVYVNGAGYQCLCSPEYTGQRCESSLFQLTITSTLTFAP